MHYVNKSPLHSGTLIIKEYANIYAGLSCEKDTANNTHYSYNNKTLDNLDETIVFIISYVDYGSGFYYCITPDTIGWSNRHRADIQIK